MQFYLPNPIGNRCLRGFQGQRKQSPQLAWVESRGGTDLALSLELKQLVITQEGPPPLH